MAPTHRRQGTRRPRHQENQYLNLVRQILGQGQKRKNRTSTDTLAKFAPVPFRFDLSNDKFPLLTTKCVYFRAIAEELLWMLSGSTDAKVLHDKGIKIWDDNTSREFLDSVGLNHLREGDAGAIYGFQWRHFGAKYINCDTDYSGQGVDQVAYIIDLIKKDPTSRRMILTSWNPAGIYEVPLFSMLNELILERSFSKQTFQRWRSPRVICPVSFLCLHLLYRLNNLNYRVSYTNARAIWVWVSRSTLLHMPCLLA